MKTLSEIKTKSELSKYVGLQFHCISLFQGIAPKSIPMYLQEEQEMFPEKVYLFNTRDGYKYGKFYDPTRVFFSVEDAENACVEYKGRFESFKKVPYLSHEFIEKHYKELKTIEDLIYKLLSGFENFDGIDFCDVGAGGIQIRLFHKQIKGYSYGAQITLNYDFSNKEDVPFLVAKEFVRTDNRESVLAEKEFIEFGEKYGWD